MNTSVISLVLGTICIGLAPIFVKNLSGDISPSMIGALRCGIAGSILLIYQLLIKKNYIKDKRFYTMTAVIGFCFAMDLFFWHRSVHLIGAGMATILGNTQVFYLLLFGLILYKEKITVKKLLVFLFAFFGVFLILKGQVQFYQSEEFFWGVLFGLITGLCYSLYTTSIKKTSLIIFKAKISPLEIITYSSLVTSCLLLISAQFEHGHNGLRAEHLPSILGLAVLCQIVGWSLISYGLKTAPLSVSGLIILLQPVIAKTLSIFLFNEPFSSLEIVGASILLTCIYLGTHLSRPKRARDIS
ncbi:DMT family transporter [Bacteriovorax sp. BAL6_X]|uniref:DMT family transporter n=1 Tax=Bacteriovorax sp. BAL6_X TaxID=1201290 RepID=UPI00058E02F0|nr:DMT family transporter [Bacteriovorax sp. BAL6_X]